MDRRAAGALLALAACIASSAAAPTASNHTALDLYEGAPEGCYYNFQHYGEGDRIMTNEPCLNCTCHNRMLMCYLRVCPFTKPIGQDCTVEKRADQCCPIITCPDVPVDLLTSTSTSSPAEYGATGLGKVDKYGCSINGKYFPEGSKVPPTPNKPCEHCYCIRNMTTCVMQECTLHVDGCTPIYHKDVCCPTRYSCDHEDEIPLLDDMSTTVRPTPGFLLTTTTISPVTQMTQDCVHNDRIISDGASITTEKACEHCYCMKGDIVCVVQECGAPMENEGKNCTSLPPREGQCCPDTYICEGDELSTENNNEITTESILGKLTTLSPPRRGGVEGSGYRIEPNEAVHTETSSTESNLEGSGDEEELSKPIEEHIPVTPEKPDLDSDNITPIVDESDQYIPVTTKTPIYDEPETSTNEIDKNLVLDSLDKETIKPDAYPTSKVPEQNAGDLNTLANLPQDYVTTGGPFIPDSNDQFTTESIPSLNTVSDISAQKEHDGLNLHTTIPADISDEGKTGSAAPQESETTKGAPSINDATLNPISDLTSEPEYLTHIPETQEITTEKAGVTSEQVTRIDKPEDVVGSTTNIPVSEEVQTQTPENLATDEISKDITKPEELVPTATNTPLEGVENPTTEVNHDQNTVVVVEEDGHYAHITSERPVKATESNVEDIVTDKPASEGAVEPDENVSTESTVLKEQETTVEPDKGLNTIPSEINEHPSSILPSIDVTTSSSEVKVPEKSSITSETSTPVLETHTTKVDLYTVTTEPSFRKEDEASISTEKTKEEFGPTTIKAEFVDEGLIPTSSHDDKLSTNSNVPITDDDITTIIPEFINESEHEAVTTKQPTSESLPETSIAVESLPEKITETSYEVGTTLSSSTEKYLDDITSVPDLYKEPSRIPGEGDCLLSGVTYTNNSIVPSSNNCHTGCKCISSIVKCDPIICSPPPDYMSNCQSIYDTPDSCCPTYICDHPRETIPPQSDNQMSGTETPVISPTIECQGDQCELNVPTQPTGPTELCSSGSCLSAPDNKSETNKCGPEGCSDVKESVTDKPSIEQTQCTDGKCGPPLQDCSGGTCQPSLSDSTSPIEPCKGDACKPAENESPTPQLCENEQECKKVEVPVTQTVTGDNCGNDGCKPSVVSSPQDSQTELCKDKENCQPEEITSADCTGEEPCRRKDSSVAEQSPHKCEGNDCTQEIVPPVDQSTDETNKVQPTSEETPLYEVTQKTTPSKEEQAPQGTEIPTLDQKIKETTPIIDSVTEPQPTKNNIPETTDTTQKDSEGQENSTYQPSINEKEITGVPNAAEDYTATPISQGDIVTTRFEDNANVEEGLKPTDNQGTQTTELAGQQQVDKEEKDKHTQVDEEVTKTPHVTAEDTDKPVSESDSVKDQIDEESVTKAPYTTERNDETPAVEVKDHSEPTNVVQDHTVESNSITEDVTKTPDLITVYTEIPQTIDEQETKIPAVIDKELEHKLSTVEEESTKTPEVTEKYNESETKIPDITKQHTDDAINVDEITTRIPDIKEIQTSSPIPVTEPNTKISDDKEPADVSSPSGEEGIKVPIVTDEYSEKYTETPEITISYTHKAPSGNELSTETPSFTDTQSYVPVSITEVPPGDEESSSDKHSTTNQPESNVSDITKEPEDKLVQTQGETTKPPEITEVFTNEQASIPEVDKEQTGEHIEIQGTILPDTKEVTTSTSVSSAEDSTKIPDSFDENEIKIPYEGDTEKENPIVPVDESSTISPDTKETVEKKPDLIQTESITESATTKDITENLEESKYSTIKPLMTDEPIIVKFDSSTNDLPINTEDSSPSPNKEKETEDEDKPSLEENATQKPTIVIEDNTITSAKPEHSNKPSVYEENTIIPETASKVPETYFTEFEKDVTLSENLLTQTTQAPDEETKKVTQASPSTEAGVTSEAGIPSKSPEITESVPLSPDSSTDFVSEVTNAVTSKQDEATEAPVGVIISESTLPPLREGEHISSNEEPLTNEQKTTESSGITIINEPTTEKVTKATELETSSGEEDGYTDIPESESSVTRSPDEVSPIKPEEGELPESLDSTQTIPTSEKIATESEITPEPHITNIVPEYEASSALPELDKVTETVDLDPHKSKLPEETEVKLETTPTMTTVKDDEKVDQPDIYTPEKEEMITAGVDSTSMQTPVEGVTNVHGEEPATTEYKETITESVEPLNSVTATKSQEGYTDMPVFKETKPAEIYDEPTTSKSSSDLPLSGEPNRRHEVPAIENTTPGASEFTATELPVATVTAAKPIASTDHIAVSEEQTTKVSVTAQEADAVPTTVPETYEVPTKEPAVTGTPDSYKPSSPEPELPKTTESSNIDIPLTSDKQTDTKLENPKPVDVEETTAVTQESANPIDSDISEPDTELEVTKSSTESPSTLVEIHTDLPITQVTSQVSLSLVTEHQPHHVTIEQQDHTEAVPKDGETEAQEQPTKDEHVDTTLLEATTPEQIDVTKAADKTSPQVELTETTPYLVELEEHTEKMVDDISTITSTEDKEPVDEKEETASTQTPLTEKPVSTQDIMTPSPTVEEHTVKLDEHRPSLSTNEEDSTQKHIIDTTSVAPSINEITTEKEHQDAENLTEKTPENVETDLETATKKSDIPSSSSEESSTISGEISYLSTLPVSVDTATEKKPISEQTSVTTTLAQEEAVTTKDSSTSKPSQEFEETTPHMDTEKSPITESNIKVPTKEESELQHASDKTTASEDEVLSSTTKVTTLMTEELLTPSSEDKYSPPEEKPTSEQAFSTSSTTEAPKPSIDLEPTEEVPAPGDDELSPSGGYGEPDYPEEDQAFGPGTCRYGGKVYVSAQQIPRDDPCDFCFCFRSDIICLQQSCPPPIHGCHEEPIQGFCCPRYECPVSMATSVNVTTTTTTTTTTLPPHFPTHGYKGGAQRRGCQIKGHTYKVGEVVRSASGPCLHCTCGGDGQMKCDPKACTPEPMLRQMIAAAVSAKRRR